MQPHFFVYGFLHNFSPHGSVERRMALDVREFAEGLGCAPLGELVGSPSEREASRVIGYRSRGVVRILGFKPPFPQPGDFRTQRSASRRPQ